MYLPNSCRLKLIHNSEALGVLGFWGSLLSWLQGFYYLILGIYVTNVNHAVTDFVEFAVLNIIVGSFLLGFKSIILYLL